MNFRTVCFDRAAHHYDAQAHIQLRLAARVTTACSENARNVLELGCGTGLLTGMLRRRLPSAFIVATDAAPEMLAQARRAFEGCARFAEQDAAGFAPPSRQVALHAPYDLLVSSALLQWLPDLDAHFRFVASLAAPGSRYVFSAFTRDNLPELNALLVAPPFEYQTFPGIEPRSIESLAARSGWILQRLEESEERKALPSPLSVLHHFRAMGASRDPRDGGRLTKSTLRSLLNTYAERHAVAGGVSLTWRSCLVVLERPNY